MNSTALLETHLSNRLPVVRGKVRDVYDLGEHLAIVATDRISAYDWVNPVGIPGKGRILTQMSLFWFEETKDIVANHLVSASVDDLPEDFRAHREQFEGRTMLVRKCAMFPVEFVIRGYLAGSGWKEYQRNSMVCGHKLPAGLLESSRLPEPIFTPATKATDGHDINITPSEAAAIIGQSWADSAEQAAKQVFSRCGAIADEKGIILCDTKLEFGVWNGRLMLADEMLTPDSSRFWPRDVYQPGKSQPSFDKQFVRDWLDTTDWDKNSPQPQLPDDVVARTLEKYVDAYQRLTGRTDF